MKKAIALLIALVPALALAAGGEGHQSEGIPSAVIYQFINVAILITGIVYFTKDSIVEAFNARKSAYVAAAEKSALAREQAEKQFNEIKGKLEQLTKNEADSIAKAKQHAEEIKQQILTEAKEVSARIRDEAQLTVQLETKRAQKELREQLLKDSVEAAKMVLSKDIAGGDHQKLQGDFVKGIEVAH